jgi:hypothetical protein
MQALKLHAVCLNSGSYWPPTQQHKQLIASTSDNKRNFIFAYTLSNYHLYGHGVWSVETPHPNRMLIESSQLKQAY